MVWESVAIGGVPDGVDVGVLAPAVGDEEGRPVDDGSCWEVTVLDTDDTEELEVVVLSSQSSLMCVPVGVPECEPVGVAEAEEELSSQSSSVGPW